MDNVNEFLKANYRSYIFKSLLGYREIAEPTRRIECNDGFSISVQANDFTYYTPRENRAWPYDEVELGYPSELDALIEDYSEDPGTTDTAYGYVPIGVVNQLIEKHGGIKD